nr:PhzF family phenazine biosynthesis protein [uncultured Flavobacterium sp.]
MKYYHVDVFSSKKFSGNGLTVFPNAENLDKNFMQLITQEMRQFESIFFYKINANIFRAFIFTTEEELDFAGHPLIGAAAILHDINSPQKETNIWTFELNHKSVEVTTQLKNGFISARMNQGVPDFGKTLSSFERDDFLEYLNLDKDDIYEDFPFEVISTGLPYLILPIKENALSKIRVTVTDLEDKLFNIGAKFFYVLDIKNRQGRTWDNLGLMEDIATGSSAGPIGAYLVQNGVEDYNSEIILKQGDFLNRPSKLKVIVTKINETFGDIYVEGDVCKIANGELQT